VNLRTNTDESVFPGFDPEDLSVFLRHAWTDTERLENRQQAMHRLEKLVEKSFQSFAKEHPKFCLEVHRGALMPGRENDGRVDAAWFALVRNETHRKAARVETESRRILRNSVGGTEHHRVHPSISARLDAQGLFVGVSLPRAASPDAHLLLERMKSKKSRAEFLEIMGSLPAQTVFGDDQDSRVPVIALSPGILKLTFDAFERGVGWLMVGRQFEPELLLSSPSTVELELSELVPALESVYAFFTFKPNLRPPKGKGRRPKSANRKPKGPKPLSRPPEISDRVRVKSGMFKGKVGTVLEMRDDAVQIKVKLLPIWVAKKDVVVLPPREAN